MACFSLRNNNTGNKFAGNNFTCTTDYTRIEKWRYTLRGSLFTIPLPNSPLLIIKPAMFRENYSTINDTWVGECWGAEWWTRNQTMIYISIFQAVCNQQYCGNYFSKLNLHCTTLHSNTSNSYCLHTYPFLFHDLYLQRSKHVLRFTVWVGRVEVCQEAINEMYFLLDLDSICTQCTPSTKVHLKAREEE